MPTIDELRLTAEKAAQDLRDAEEALRNAPGISTDEAQAIFNSTIESHAVAESIQAKHDVALAGLSALESGKHKGREIDILAQHVLDAREAGVVA